MEPDLILITETWCNNDITNAYLSVAGYELQPDLRVDREDTNGGRGGGLLVYSKCGLQILKLDCGALFKQHCKFLVNDIIFYIYWSPISPASNLTKLADLVSGAEKNCVIIGDFNLPNIDWERGVATGPGKELLEAVEDKLMSQLVEFSTQIKGNILDLVLTNMPERISEVREEGRLGKSDHCMIVTEISVGKSSRDNLLPSLDWRRADWDGMKAELSGAWRREVMLEDGDMAWRMMKARVEDLIRRFVPERRRRNQNRPVWMTQEILRAIRKKKRLWKRDKHKADKAEYNEHEKKTRNLIRNGKRRFEKRLATGNGGNNRPFFSYVKQKTKSRPSVGPLKSGGQMVTGNRDMANLLNKCLGDAFTREGATDIPEPAPMEIGSMLEEVSIKVRDVKKKIRALRSDAAAGPDGIGPRVLQALQNELAPVLAHNLQENTG